MRIRIKFQSTKANFSHDYREEFIKYIKRVAYYNDRDIYMLLFFNGSPPEFSFSVYFNKAKFNKNGIYVPKFSDIYMTISFSSKYDKHLSKLIEMINVNDIYSDGLIFKGYKRLDAPLIKENQVFIEMLSPLIIKNIKDSTFIDCTSSSFEDLTALNILGELNQFNEECLIKMVSVKPKKTVVKYKGKYINASLGQYLLISNSVEGVRRLYDIGIGSKRGDGFGLFQIIK